MADRPSTDPTVASSSSASSSESDSDARERAIATVRRALEGADLEWEELRHGVFSVTLPGERKLQTPCRIDVGKHSIAVHAFVLPFPSVIGPVGFAM